MSHQQQQSHHVVVEVCQGPDCFGAGGGAALLEIEELVQEQSGGIQVVPGGCRNFCSMGPNVHCRGQHFTKVVGTVECREVIDKMIVGDKEEEAPFPIHTKLLLRQADRQRWQALRQMARIRKSPTQVPIAKIETAKRELLEALAKEEQVAVRSNNNRLLHRVQRKRERFLASLECIRQDNADLSESSEEEEEEDNG